MTKSMSSQSYRSTETRKTGFFLVNKGHATTPYLLEGLWSGVKSHVFLSHKKQVLYCKTDFLGNRTVIQHMLHC